MTQKAGAMPDHEYKPLSDRLTAIEERQEQHGRKLDEIHTALVGDLKGPGFARRLEACEMRDREQEESVKSVKSWALGAIGSAIVAGLSALVGWMFRGPSH